MFTFGINSKQKAIVQPGSYSFTVGQDGTEYGFSVSAGSLVPQGLTGFVVNSFITAGPDTLVLSLGDGNDFIPGYIYVQADIGGVAVTLTLNEDGTSYSYSATYVGIRNILSIENTKTISLLLNPLPADNALHDKYKAYLIDDSNNAITY